MGEKVEREVIVQYSADGSLYYLPDVEREGGIWLGVDEMKPPIPPDLRRPGLAGAAVIPGAPYWRRFSALPQIPGRTATLPADHRLVRDWRIAYWWSPVPGWDAPEHARRGSK